MLKRMVSGIMLTLFLIGMLTLAFNIQPVKASGTVYIRADGSVDPDTAPISSVDNITYTFTGNIYDEIVVERSNIIIDGNGYTLQGSGSGNGFDLSGINNVTIKNTSIKNFDYGVHFYSSSYNTVSSNNVSSNGYLGIQLVYSSNCSVSGNNVRNNDYYGISLWDCSNCTVSGNNVTNHERGLWLDYSSNCVLRNNSMIDNSYNFGVSGKSLKHYVQDVDISNTVNGKPVYYLLNQNDLTVCPSTYPDIGYLGLVNSTNIKVVDLMLTNNLQGVLFSYTTDSTIKNITTNNNIYGIHLDNSSNCSVSGNIATNNWFAIRLDHSRVCLVSSNIATNNWYGIALSSSSRCSISGNNASNNTRSGIVLEESSKCLVSGNDANNNHERGIWLYGFSSRFVSNCSVSGNNASNNEYGIYLSHSGKYSVSENNVSNNEYGIWLKKSNNNTIYHNNFISNTVQVNTNGSINVWDDGYPSGGNYWSDYVGVDVKSGLGQDLSGSDGIGDASYIIDANNTDRYPLMVPYGAPPPPTYTLTITATVGGITDPAPGTYSYTADSTFQVTAIPDANYLFDHWELDDVNIGSANPYTVLVDKDHTLKAVFELIPPPLSTSISPLSASINVGEPLTFTSTVSGGYAPYSYQWYLNGNPVSGANASSWTFTPTASGIYYVHLKVTDAKGNSTQSETARITVSAVPVGGYSIPIKGYTMARPLTLYLALIAILTASFTIAKRRKKQQS